MMGPQPPKTLIHGLPSLTLPPFQPSSPCRSSVRQRYSNCIKARQLVSDLGWWSCSLAHLCWGVLIWTWSSVATMQETLRKPQLRCWLPLEDMLPTSRCFSFYQGSVCGTYHCRKSQTNHPELPGIQHTYWKPPLRIGLQRLNFIQGGPKNQV